MPATHREIRDALGVLQADGRLGSALAELRGLKIRPGGQRFVAQFGKRELIRLVIVDRPRRPLHP